MTDVLPRFDPEILALIPHRPPMLLINKILAIDNKQSSAAVFIDRETPFFKIGSGVPTCIGLEYMGQTAALIAGHEIREKTSEVKLGFLLGTRKYQSTIDYFKENSVLEIICTEGAMVGDTLASFNCEIRYQNESEVIASAKLSVLRKPVETLQ